MSSSKLKKFLPGYPDIKVEVNINYGLADIAAEGIDAGVRIGEQVAQDMIAVRIGPDFRMVAIDSPTYFEHHSLPRAPQNLTRHSCINLRLPTYGRLYAWEFKKGTQELNVRAEDQLVFNSTPKMLKVALKDSAWPICRRKWCNPIWPKSASSRC